MKHKLLILVMALMVAVTSSAQFSGSGEGTEKSPYLIYNEIQLSQLSNFLNQSDVYFSLMKDLDLTDFIDENYPSEGWTPIGVESTPFKGHFDGNNHTLSGIWIDKSSIGYVGFFGYLDGAVISNLTIEGTSIAGVNQVGAFAGYATSATITNCAVTFSDKVQGTKNVGGFVGQTSACNIQNCTVNTTVSGTSNVAGCVGCISSTKISSTKVNGNVFGSTNVAGIAGYVEGTQTLQNLTYIGNVSGDANVSGIAGQLASESSTTFTSCFSKGKITNSGDYTGGIVALSNGVAIAAMTDCSHFGDIEGKQYTGGLIGGVTGTSITNGVITNGVSDTNVYLSTSSSSNKKTVTKSIYDLISTTTSSVVNNCTAIGNITGTSYTGGLVGKDEASSLTCSDWVTGGKSTLSYGNSGMFIWFNNTLMYRFSEESFSPNISQKTLAYTNSYYSGIINGTDNVGGIAGYKRSGKIQYCYTNASIYADNQVGGIVGDGVGVSGDKLTIESNVAINNTISATVANIGRIYGRCDSYTSIGALGTAAGNRALTTTKVVKQGVVQEITDNLQNGNVMGVGLLKQKANYVGIGWDFNSNWVILDTESFPYKKYQAAPPVIESDLVSQGTTISGSSTDGGTVYLYYRNREPVSTTCSGNAWSFTTEQLQSGASVQLYSDVDNMTPSYFVTATVGYPGSGKEKDPYRIYTAEDLQGASNKGYYKIMNDIDLTEWITENSPQKGWVSIGRNSGESTHIDGDGHTITGLWINTTEDYTGLFSNFSAGDIKNLTVEVASGKQVKGGNYTGILIGRNTNGQIINCNVKGDVSGTGVVGGVAGYSSENTIENITFSGNVSTATASASVGGFAGQSYNDQLSNVRTIPTISVTNNSAQVGGLIGYASGSTIAKTSAEANITVSGSGSKVGGLVGYSESAISESYSKGTVECLGEESYTGGLVGMAKNDITNCYSNAVVKGTLHTAGLCAYTYNKINKCYANGNINGVSKGAGVVSYLYGSSAGITNCVAMNNTITLTDQSSFASRVVGGIGDGASEPNSTNFALDAMQVSLNGVAQKKKDDPFEGIAKPESELMSQSFYSGLDWDMSSVWGINEGTEYPYLRFFNSGVQSYTVVFRDYDGKELKKQIVEQGKSATAPNNPTREGYTFTGWDKEFSNVTSDLTITAQYKINTYTVTFLDNNGKELKKETVEYGKSATAPIAPTVDGYTFTGWDNDFSKVTSDLTVKAQYKSNDSNELVISDDKVISTSSDLIESGRDIDLTLGSALVIDGNVVQKIGTITQRISMSSAASIVACKDNLSADILKIQFSTQTGTWYYLCFPFNVPFSGISSPGQYAVYEYDGAIRAQKGSGGWVRTQGDKLVANKGYIFQASESGDLVVSISNPAFSCEAAKSSLPVHSASAEYDANWSLIGNPFPSYFDMQVLNEGGFNAPIYVRSKNKDDYDVYMPADDEYHFRPYEAFFVQNPNNSQSTLQWLSSGCETEKQSKNGKNAPRRVAQRALQAEQNRYFVELYLTGNNCDDHTRVVFNDEAKAEYELGRDAVKMEGSAPVRIYSLDAQAKYAINERPAQDISLGYTVATDGDYTLSVSRMDKDVELYDNELNTVVDLSQGSYLFHTLAGTNNTRFSLRPKANMPSDIDIVGQENGKVNIYTLTGAMLYENVEMNNVKLQSGIYIIKSDNQVKKVVVK